MICKYLNLSLISAVSALALSPLLAHSEIRIPSLEHNPNFEKIKSGSSFLCVGEKSVGYDWNKNKWENKTFKADRWIIRKEESDSKYCNLSGSIDINYQLSDKNPLWNLKRCYSIKRFGTSQELGGILNTDICYETYSGVKFDKVSIQCADHIFYTFAFVPNGPYLMQTSNPSIPSTDGKVDSIFMETGVCSSM